MARKLKVDLTGVEAFVLCEEGQHVAVIDSIEEKVASTGNDMLVVKSKVTKGNSVGAIVYDNIVLTEKSLWKLKLFLEALGLKADGKVAIDLDKLVGKAVIIDVIHEEYNGNPKAKLLAYKKLTTQAKPAKTDEDWEDDEGDWDEQ